MAMIVIPIRIKIKNAKKVPINIVADSIACKITSTTLDILRT